MKCVETHCSRLNISTTAAKMTFRLSFRANDKNSKSRWPSQYEVLTKRGHKKSFSKTMDVDSHPAQMWLEVYHKMLEYVQDKPPPIGWKRMKVYFRGWPEKKFSWEDTVEMTERVDDQADNDNENEEDYDENDDVGNEDEVQVNEEVDDNEDKGVGNEDEAD